MKIISVLISFMLLFCSCSINVSNKNSTNDFNLSKSRKSSEIIKGVWISCYELDFKDKSRTAFIKKINEIFTDIKNKNFNAVFVHVRSHSDAYYESDYFPFSSFIVENQGENPGYDPLEIMCYLSNIHKLQIHAWINPFRITSTDDISGLSTDNPAYNMIKSNSREVRKTKNGYYYNPSYKSVRTLIINGIEELLKNYDINGIHFDDYFYPTSDKTFDDKEFNEFKKQNNSSLSLEDWRRENINKLIKNVYKTSHKYNKIFGVSPHCSFYYNYNIQYADINKWCNSDGYIDYIAPQIYFDFETDEKTEDMQPLAFKECLSYWEKSTGDTPLYIGLALYKCGTEGEWAECNDVIARQIKYTLTTTAKGYIVFSYSYFAKNKEETNNIVSVNKNN